MLQGAKCFHVAPAITYRKGKYDTFLSQVMCPFQSWICMLLTYYHLSPTAFMECIIKNTTGLPIIGVAVMITGSQQPFPASVIRTFQLDDVRLRFLCIVAVIIGMVYWVMLIN